MVAPLQSTVSLITEIIISSLIIFIFYNGYKNNKFYFKLTIFTIFYEILFNISYMVYRVIEHSQSVNNDSTFEIILAIFHGTLSLIMFIALLVFLIFAFVNYKKGINYFRKHKKLTIAFLTLWLMAVFSGILFYFIEYL